MDLQHYLLRLKPGICSGRRNVSQRSDTNMLHVECRFILKSNSSRLAFEKSHPSQSKMQVTAPLLVTAEINGIDSFKVKLI